MPDHKEKVISTLMHTTAAFGIGYFSKTIVLNYGGSMLAFIGAAVLILINLIVKYILKKREFKWWMANGIWPYLATWFAIWVIVINI